MEIENRPGDDARTSEPADRVAASSRDAQDHGDTGYRALLAEGPLGYVTTTRQGTISYANAKATAMFGVGTCHAIGLPFQCFLAPTAREPWAAHLASTAAASSATSGAFITINSFDRGRSTRAWMRAARIADDHGSFAGHRLLLADLDSEDRSKKVEALETECRNKDVFLAVLAHELRNPLAPMRALVELWRGRPDAPGIDRDRALDIFDRQIEHMAHLLDDLLDLSRVSFGKFRLLRRVHDLSDTVARAVEAVRVSAGRHALEVSLPEHPLWIKGDPTRIRQIVANLVDNAIKYTPPSGRVFVELCTEKAEAVLIVRDTGIGIRRDMLESIFRLFARGDRSLAHHDGGLGIGLNLVRQLVEMHDGTVSAQSDGVGRGSTFLVRLPLVDAPRRRRRAPGPTHRPSAGRRAGSPMPASTQRR